MRSGLVRLALVLALPAAFGGCGGGGRGGGPAAGPSGSAAGPAAGGGFVPAAVDFTQLAAGVDARRDAYLRAAAQGLIGGAGENVYTEIARLETGILPVAPGAIDDAAAMMDRREDTADFGANALLRLLHLHGSNPALPAAAKSRAEAALIAFKYWIDEPGRDEMVYWSENHQVLFATAEYLAGHLFPQRVFPNAGLTGAQHAQKARGRLLRWLDARLRFGWSEWYSPVYYEEDLAPLFNLADFAPDADIRERAAMAIDLLIFDLARLTLRGSFGVTSGRAYAEHKLSGWGQSVGDLVEILFGTRGRFTSRGSPAATAFASSRGYRVPHVLLAIGRDAPARSIDRARLGVAPFEGPGEGIGFQSFEDGMFWWGEGAYFSKETIVLSRRMIDAWGLWNYPYFQALAPMSAIPDALLPGIADALSPLSEGSILGGASAYAFKTPDAMLSSVQSYRRGQVAFQQHAWQATLDMDAVVFTTAPGTGNHDGPNDWTGSASLPRVFQVENAAIVLYNPSIAQKAVFPHFTHAYFPRAAFDEVVDAGGWTFGRKGEGYVALYSALPASWQQAGPFAQAEVIAPGDRNVWICQIGRRAEDGAFADFRARVLGARLAVVGAGNAPQTDPLTVSYDAPGLGPIEVAWDGAPLVGGVAVPEGGFPRWENPYARVPWGAPQYEIRCAGAVLRHDRGAGNRTGDGI